jgi:hypothetical protein
MVSPPIINDPAACEYDNPEQDLSSQDFASAGMAIDVDIPSEMVQPICDDEPELEDINPVPPPPRQNAFVEEVANDNGDWCQQFPLLNKTDAGTTFGKTLTNFKVICDDQILKGEEVLRPFASKDE